MASRFGQTVSHYRILDKLVEGGVGVVHKAHYTKVDRPAAQPNTHAGIPLSVAEVGAIRDRGRDLIGFGDIHPRRLSRQRAPLFLVLVMQFCSLLLAQEKLLPVIHFKVLPASLQGAVTSRVVRDSSGFVWIGTTNGLYRFDGYGTRAYRNNPNDPHSLPSVRIHSLLVDSNGRLWIGTLQTGLCLYDATRDRFIQVFPDTVDWPREEEPTVFSVFEDRSKNIWLAMNSRVVRLAIPREPGLEDPEILKHKIHITQFQFDNPTVGAYDICERSDGRVIIASRPGLFILDTSTSRLKRPQFSDPVGRQLDTARVSCMVQQQDGIGWLGTRRNGIFRVDWETGKVANYRHRKGDSLSIGTDDIWDLAVDNHGQLWIGTFYGVELFSTESGKRVPYFVFEDTPLGNDRLRLSFDHTGTLWIGSRGIVYRLSRRSQLFPHYSFPGRNKIPKTNQAWLGSIQGIRRGPDGKLWGISDGTLRQIEILAHTVSRSIDFFAGKRPSGFVPSGPTSFTLDKEGNFWYAAWELGLYGINPVTGKVRCYNYKTPFGMTPWVRSVDRGSGDTLWVGGFEYGVFKFNPTSGKFLKTGIKNGYTVMSDHEGKIWTTGFDGLFVLDPASGKSDRFYSVPSDSHSLNQTLTWSTYEDSCHRIWIGAGNVINLLDPASRSFTRFPNPAFSECAATPIGSDGQGRLWIGYDKGRMSILDPSTGSLTNFDYDDGLCGGITGVHTLEDGKIVIAGWAGLNIISLGSIEPDRSPPPLLITRMAINDVPAVPPRMSRDSGLLRLSHTQDVFEFEYAAIDIDGRGPAEYQYQLEGQEQSWVKANDRRYVRYTGVPPGEYVFRVRAASAWGRWADQEIAIAISIAPPWWRSTWAYAGYMLICLSVLYSGYRIRMRQVQLKHDAEMAGFKADHLAEMDQMKSRFFANISHEFRTPLTLILGPLESLMDESPTDRVREKLAMIKRNAQALLRLINQLLDLSKLEAGAMIIRPRRMDIVPIVKGIAGSFETSAGLRGVALDIQTAPESMEFYGDREMVEKILRNLLSNAFKFTPRGGRVGVSLNRINPDPVPGAQRKDGAAQDGF
ncbi:MAG TPA: two-component regulator propeller domain-containing protein, partial [Bacteroidota bacterium]|nr:two-component regulator propeller domain-containing protein [Bacteroidota bacterium]